MAKNHMPVAHFGVRPDDIRADVAPPNAFEKWRPEIRAVAAESDDASLVIDVLGLIGETWDGSGVTDHKVGALLRGAGTRNVIVNINSPGGDFFDGLAIYNLLRTHKGDVTVRIVGIAASAASIIAMAGDRIEIARSAFLMIHNTRTIAMADQHGFRGLADQLAVFDEAMADLYAVRSTLAVDEITKMMDRESFISGRTAISQGFADALLEADLVGVDERARDDAKATKANAEFAFMARKAGYTRSQAIDLKNRISSKPSAADTGMPSAAESMAALMGSVTSTLAKME